MKLSILISVVLIALVELGAPLFARLFTADAEVIRIAALNMRIEILGQIFYSIFLIYHAMMIGAGRHLYGAGVLLCELHFLPYHSVHHLQFDLGSDRNFCGLCHCSGQLYPGGMALYAQQPLAAFHCPTTGGELNG